MPSLKLDPTRFRLLHVDLEQGTATTMYFGEKAQVLGGSGLAAALFERYGKPLAPWNDPEQPLIFAVGPLTAYFPLMSKVVCAFKSPHTGFYTESHAGGRLALAMKFAGYHALMITGAAKSLSVLSVGSRSMDIEDVHYLRGQDVFATGKLLRRVGSGGKARGHRSIMRIGPAGENGSAYACINVDTYRHFGRLGAGSVMGAKNLKAIAVLGDASEPYADDFDAKGYASLYKDIYKQLTGTDMMLKYYDLGTPSNLIPLNELKSLPWRNLQQTTDPGVEGISGERFADQLLIRQTACSGCPVGCIHIGLLRQQFAKNHEFLYRQVNYDYESIFAEGSMLGLTEASEVLALLDETEKMGLDVMSAGVCLAWATEALETGQISDKETIVPLAFGKIEPYLEAVRHIGHMTNDFYRALAMGLNHATEVYGGYDFACVLGQEMAGYATGEVFYAAETLGFRNSHLDSGGYAYDQKNKDQDVDKAVAFLVKDETARVGLTSMVSCLFARGVYSVERMQEALGSVGLREVADNLEPASAAIQAKRHALKVRTGFDPMQTTIPKRYQEVTTWKGQTDPLYLEALRTAYAKAIAEMAASDSPGGA